MAMVMSLCGGIWGVARALSRARGSGKQERPARGEDAPFRTKGVHCPFRKTTLDCIIPCIERGWNASVGDGGIPSGADAAARKLAAKRVNERLKLLANLLNALGIGVIGAGVIVPGVHDPTRITLQTLAWIATGLVLHLLAQGVLAFLRSED
ncbi:hypothetical protein [Methylobacterium sp. WL69]|uniref:hypothetical protein n=1 Tax=Methylobacterium sp. WL69 TaxID=2603893 RepID=UPI001FEDA893|nr:hypothetical protein [Methylobacterium sp. WL69]